MQTSYFGYSGQARLRTPKKIVSVEFSDNFLVITSSLLKCFFIALLQYLLSLTILLLKLQTTSSPKYELKDLLILPSTHTNF